MGGYVRVHRLWVGGFRIGGVEATSQLSGESGVSVIVVLGDKSAGILSRCSMKETWKESKIHPKSRSQSQYAFECGEYLIRVHGQDRV